MMWNVRLRWMRAAVVVGSVLLLATSVAKLVSSAGNSRVLQTPDPIFGIEFRYLFCIVGAIELAVSLYGLYGRRPSLQIGLMAWLATGFLTYRLGLVMVGYHKPCSCLGNLTDSIHMSPSAADSAAKAVLAYLIVTSYGALLWLWKQKGSYSEVPVK
jgi:hypothetical protein